MRSPLDERSDTEERDELVTEADGIRSRLLEAVDALDRRRHDAFDVRLQVRRHAPALLAAGALAALSLVGVFQLARRLGH